MAREPFLFFQSFWFSKIQAAYILKHIVISLILLEKILWSDIAVV